MKVFFQGAGLLKDVTSYVTSFSTTAEMKSGRLIGNAISLMVDISFNNLTGILNGAATGDFYIDVRQSDIAGTPTQKFTVMDAPERYTSKLKLTMYDGMVKLNSPYKSSYAYVEGNYPTIAQQLAEIAALADVTFNTEWLPDAVLNKTAYWIDTTVNMREYVARIAELAGCNAYVNSANQICFKRLLADHFTAAFASNFDKYDLLTITQVVYDDGLIRYAAGSSSGKTMFLSPDNAYIDSQEAVDAVFDLYDGASFCPLATMKTFGQDGMMPGCLVTYDSIPCIVTSVKRAYHGEGSSVVLNGSVSNENGDKVTVVNDRTRIRQIRTILDQEAGRLQVLAEDVEDNSARIGELEISAERFRTSISSIESDQQNTIIKTETYYLVNNGSVPSKDDIGWSKQPRAVSVGEHLWQMVETTSLAGIVVKSEPVDLTGAGVVSATMHYTTSASPDYPEVAALYFGNDTYFGNDVFFTTEAAGWTTDYPSFDPDSHLFLWERWKLVYSDGSFVWTDPVCAEWFSDVYSNLNGKITKNSTDIIQTQESITLKADKTVVTNLTTDLSKFKETVVENYNAAIAAEASQVKIEVGHTIDEKIGEVSDSVRTLEQYTKLYVKEDGVFVEDSDHDSKTIIDGAGFRVLDKNTDDVLLSADTSGVTAKQLTSVDGLKIETSQVDMDQSLWYSATDREYGIAVFVTGAL